MRAFLWSLHSYRVCLIRKYGCQARHFFASYIFLEYGIPLKRLGSSFHNAMTKMLQTLTCVRSEMTLEEPWPWKCFATNGAFAVLIVRSDMHGKGRHGNINFATHMALLGFFIVQGPATISIGNGNRDHAISSKRWRLESSKRPLLEEVAWSRLLCLIQLLHTTGLAIYFHPIEKSNSSECVHNSKKK